LRWCFMTAKSPSLKDSLAWLTLGLVLIGTGGVVSADSMHLSASDWASILQQLPQISQQAYLKASNTGPDDTFGTSLAISGNTVVIGSPGEDSSATGVNGNQQDNSGSGSGAAYVFVRAGTNWTQQAYLKASNTGVNDGFGVSVAISGDTIVVGARGEDSSATGVNGNQNDNSATDSGAAYVFVRNGTNWTQQGYLKASNTGASDGFGQAMALFGDILVIGAGGERSNATGVNGNQNDDSATSAGAAYVFVRNGTTWQQQAYLKASNTGANDFFGLAVGASADTVVVAARDEDSNAIGVNGNQNDNSAASAGAAYVFVRDGTNWSQQAYLKASNTEAGDWFGWSVAISGNTIVVGALSEDSGATGVNGNQSDNSATVAGAAYVFVRAGTNWGQQAYLKASNTAANDRFGHSIGFSGDVLVIGAIEEDSNAKGVNGNQNDNSASASGAAYAFARNGTNWSQQAYLKASNTEANDYFGVSPAVSDDTVVIAGWREDSGATGVNGNQSDNSAATAGAAYVFAGLGLPPSLTIERSLSSLGVSWPLPATGFVLEETPVLASSPATTLWSQVPLPYETNSLQIFVTIPEPISNKFYRLRRP
jgi:trimeric autotransporter adhesin